MRNVSHLDKSTGTILKNDVQDLLEAAVSSLPRKSVKRARSTIHRINSSAPPILAASNLIAVAKGVLRGSEIDKQLFQDTLKHFGTWNSSKLPKHPPICSVDHAKKLIDLWANIKQPMEHEHSQSPIRNEAIVTLTAAAVVTGFHDPIRLVQNVFILHEQFMSLEAIGPLLRDARRALLGQQHGRERFLDALSILEGPGWPLPEPIPGWIPGELPPLQGFCDAITVTALLGALQQGSTYTIDSIEPERTCPNKMITIHGSGFQGPNYSGHRVRFPGLTYSTDILAVPTSVSMDTIEVVVPDGAASGYLSIKIEAGVLVEPCGVELEIDPIPAGQTPFNGGITTILDFRIIADECLHAGEATLFTWRLSNADEVSLVIEYVSPEGAVTENVPPLDIGTDSYTHTMPSNDFHTFVTARLVVDGPCGSDTQVRQRPLQKSLAGAANFTPFGFENWHHNFQHPVLRCAPALLDDLVTAIAQRTGEDELGVMGSAWSFTDCVAPEGTDYLIDTSELNNVLEPIPYLDDVQSVLSERVLSTLNCPPARDRLIYVEAGIKLHRLNCQLDCRGLAMPSLGGDNGQSIAGAFSTGTHGANSFMPPIADQVRAIHLVGPGGIQWWIEPSGDLAITESDPDSDTDPYQWNILRQATSDTPARFDPCLRVVHDDDLFNACLVSFGSAGVIYAVVLEAVSAHRLSSTTEITEWADAQIIALDQVILPDEPAAWYLEIITDPTRQCWVTTRAPSEDDIIESPDSLGLAAAVIAEITDLVAKLAPAVALYLIGRFALLAFSYLNPFGGFLQIAALKTDIEIVITQWTAIGQLVRIRLSSGDERVVAQAIPAILNAVWRIGGLVKAGRNIVDAIQAIIATVSVRPVGTTVLPSYRAMTGQAECVSPNRPRGDEECSNDNIYIVPRPHEETQKLVHSMTFAIPAENCLAFVNDILEAADLIRETDNALILTASIRFTGKSRGLLAMQQWEKSAHIEFYTFDGMNGSNIMEANIDAIAIQHEAVPHWGQAHRDDLDLSAYYPALSEWQDAMDQIAIEGGDAANIFRHSFARNRNILHDLQV